MSNLQARLEASENQKAEFEFQYEEENAKLVDLTGKLTELQIKLDERNQEIKEIRDNQTTSVLNIGDDNGDVEFALEEQKCLVQDMENRLAIKEQEGFDQARIMKDLVSVFTFNYI